MHRKLDAGPDCTLLPRWRRSNMLVYALTCRRVYVASEPSALRLARAGSERSPGGGPDRRKPNARPTRLPQGDAGSGGKSADEYDPSGSIASVDVHSCARSGTWATTRRVPGTVGWSDGRGLPRKDMIRGRPVWKAPLRKPAVFPVARTLRGARSAPMTVSAVSRAKERWRRFVIQALAGQEFGTTAGRKPGFFGITGTHRVGL